MSRVLVSTIISAYNMVGYVGHAIDSALSQERVCGPVEVIVVDDGSTDRTADVLVGYGDAIRVITQENFGQEAAVKRGLEAAAGEYIALLDADDVWRPDRLARHLEALRSRPSVGLVYGDMEVIDDDGGVALPSYYLATGIEPTEGRVLGRLLDMNFIATSGITFRSSLVPAVTPVVEHSAYADWGVVVSVAAVSEIARVPGISFGYRRHASNRLLGPKDPVRDERRKLPWYRWMMTNVAADPTVSVGELARLLQVFLDALRVVTAAATDGDPRRALEVNRAAAERALAEAPPVGAGARRSRGLMRALGFDPFDAAALSDLQKAFLAEAKLPPPVVPEPITTTFGDEPVRLARLDELLAAPDALRAYGSGQRTDPRETLAILRAPGEDTAALAALTQSDGGLSNDGVRAVVIDEPVTTPAWAWLQARASGWLSADS